MWWVGDGVDLASLVGFLAIVGFLGSMLEIFLEFASRSGTLSRSRFQAHFVVDPLNIGVCGVGDLRTDPYLDRAFVGHSRGRHRIKPLLAPFWRSPLHFRELQIAMGISSTINFRDGRA